VTILMGFIPLSCDTPILLNVLPSSTVKLVSVKINNIQFTYTFVFYKHIFMSHDGLLEGLKHVALLIYLSFRSCDSCRRLPKPKHHSFMFNH
jgi:hypothetical protein